jgi:hypothetical protein
VRGTTLRVLGVFRDEVAPRTADVALCAPPDARALLGLDEDEATDFALELRSPSARPAVLRAAAGAGGGGISMNFLRSVWAYVARSRSDIGAHDSMNFSIVMR